MAESQSLWLVLWDAIKWFLLALGILIALTVTYVIGSICWDLFDCCSCFRCCCCKIKEKKEEKNAVAVKPTEPKPAVTPTASTSALSTAVCEAKKPAEKVEDKPMEEQDAKALVEAIERGLVRSQRDDESIDDHKTDWGKTQMEGGKTVTVTEQGTTTGGLKWKK